MRAQQYGAEVELVGVSGGDGDMLARAEQGSGVEQQPSSGRVGQHGLYVVGPVLLSDVCSGAGCQGAQHIRNRSGTADG